MTPRLHLLVGALIGVLALAAALAAGHLVAGFVGPNSSPYLAVGNGAIDLTPTPLKEFAVENFGTNDKLVLLAGMAVVMVLAAAVAGVLSRRRVLIGQIVIGLFGIVGIVAVYHRPDLGPIALLAPVASLLVGVAAFTWLHRLALRYRTSQVASGDQRAVAADSTTANAATDATAVTGATAASEAAAAPATEAGASADGAAAPNRRRFLAGSAGVAVGAAVAGGAGQLIGSSNDAGASRAAVGPLTPTRVAPPIPADADFVKLGTPPFITANRDYYRVDTALVVPQVRTEDWSLRIHGMVDNEVKFSYSDIRDMPLIERTITMTCVSNPVGGPYISTANWIGVDLAELLNKAGIQQGAEQLYSTSVDGWNAGTPISVATDPNRGAILAIGMNGEALPVEHGFPARMVIPGLFGYVSATKWVTDLEVTTWKARQSYWLKRGWGEQGPIKTQSRIDMPKGFADVPAGKVTVSGIAWAQHTGIEKVEVQVDSKGEWMPVNLSTEVNVDTWRMWWIELPLDKGEHQVTVRATDKSGYTQTEERVDTVPDGATGRPTVSFSAR